MGGYGAGSVCVDRYPEDGLIMLTQIVLQDFKPLEGFLGTLDVCYQTAKLLWEAGISQEQE